MRISDWSSDVCSSDLFRIQDERRVVAFVRALVPEVAGLAFTADFKAQAAWSRMRSRHQAGECRAEQGVGLVADGFHRGQAETRQNGSRTPQARGSQFRINVPNTRNHREIGRAHVCTTVTNAQPGST